jgi:hypothetical protein
MLTEKPFGGTTSRCQDFAKVGRGGARSFVVDPVAIMAVSTKLFVALQLLKATVCVPSEITGCVSGFSYFIPEGLSTSRYSTSQICYQEVLSH